MNKPLINSIFFGENALDDLRTFIADTDLDKLFVFTDANTTGHCLAFVQDHLVGIEIDHLEMRPGEEYKNLDMASNLWQKLLEKGASRKSLLIALGGGVVTDLGGFVSATYKRGIRFIHVPTTLLGMVDAAIGGKTGIDFEDGKNMIGTFTQPEAIFIYPPFLQTLPPNQVQSGWAEVLKHGLITDRQYWNEIKNKVNLAERATCIERSVGIKVEVVQEDEQEAGKRKVLNFGHTLGHAVESHFLAQGKPILHGEAVAAGLLMEAFLSQRMTGLPKEDFSEIKNCIVSQFEQLPIAGDDICRIVEWLKHDKKNTGYFIQCVLLKQIGQAEIDVPISTSQATDALNWYCQLAY